MDTSPVVVVAQVSFLWKLHKISCLPLYRNFFCVPDLLDEVKHDVSTDVCRCLHRFCWDFVRPWGFPALYLVDGFCDFLLGYWSCSHCQVKTIFYGGVCVTGVPFRSSSKCSKAEPFFTDRCEGILYLVPFLLQGISICIRQSFVFVSQTDEDSCLS
ncbi:hypothetical protein DPMN_053619 [Dreissena polymorpha]|uniref:Uncharacterized protein n=1 Tax=Dreissena polymorpha TaxID=45954 RepID=A0A9D4HP03_DREPO|nr:hypothetical protein DPMN_053619 [Dreissena polymorpha]